MSIRDEYRKVRDYLLYDSKEGKEELKEIVVAAVQGLIDPKPEAYLVALKLVRLKCGSCFGTGVYGTNNAMAKKGECYRCNGKGTQNWEDGRRNAYYDKYGRMP